ncbi:MAG: SRPBCC domain-containing protein [Patescibacteria group bacterium]|mgnify:CR=1 FL=1
MTEFVITRTFNAPREAVWQALSKAEALAQWWGPKGFKNNVKKFEFRQGGMFHYHLQGPMEMWARFLYQEIVEPEKIEFISSFSDPSGEIARAPFFDGKWPLEIHNVITLQEQDGKTMLTLKANPINATAEEIAQFEKNNSSMDQGYTGTWSQLDEYLKNN